MIPTRTPTNLSVIYYKCTLRLEVTLCVTLRKRIFSSMMYRYRVEYRDCLSTLTICARSVHSVEVRWRYSSPKSFSCSCLNLFAPTETNMFHDFTIYRPSLLHAFVHYRSFCKYNFLIKICMRY